MCVYVQCGNDGQNEIFFLILHLPRQENRADLHSVHERQQIFCP